MKHPDRLILGILLASLPFALLNSAAYFIANYSGGKPGGWVFSGILVILSGLVAYWIIKTVMEIGFVQFLTAASGTPELDFVQKVFEPVVDYKKLAASIHAANGNAGFMLYIYGLSMRFPSGTAIQMEKSSLENTDQHIIQLGPISVGLIGEKHMKIAPDSMAIMVADAVRVKKKGSEDALIFQKTPKGGIRQSGNTKISADFTSGFLDTKRPAFHLVILR